MTHIEQRYDTAAAWTAENPVLHAGEAGHEDGTGKWKMGDGETPWNDLLYKGGVDSVAGKTGAVDLEVEDVDGAAPLADPEFTGNPTGPTRATSDDSTSLATTEFVKNQGYATIDSPEFINEPTAPTPDADDDNTRIATTAWVRDLLLEMHPVGDIKMTAVNVNPGTYLGGTWVAWGSGRVPVGVDVGIPAFSAVEETGGEIEHVLTKAETPSVTGGIQLHQGAGGSDLWDPTGAFVDSPVVAGAHRLPNGVTAASSSLNQINFDNEGEDEAHNNLQPYITCYMFKRTA